MSPTSYAQAINAYKKVDVMGGVDAADPHQLVTMLMDGALTRLYEARTALEEKAFARKGEALGQTTTIIGALQGSLDMERGGAVADNLNELYDYLSRRVFHANVHNDVDAVDEAVRLIRDLRDGWAAIPDAARDAAAASGQVGAR
jgi:flagellar protein FliS